MSCGCATWPCSYACVTSCQCVTSSERVPSWNRETSWGHGNRSYKRVFTRKSVMSCKCGTWPSSYGCVTNCDGLLSCNRVASCGAYWVVNS